MSVMIDVSEVMKKPMFVMSDVNQIKELTEELKGYTNEEMLEAYGSIVKAINKNADMVMKNWSQNTIAKSELMDDLFLHKVYSQFLKKRNVMCLVIKESTMRPYE